jgi:uncharacterized protein with PhoU and TrkA domain
MALSKKEIMKDLVGKKRNVIDLIIEMKDLTGLAIDLGFSALLLQDKKLAEKVKELEEQITIKQYEIETKCMLAASEPEEALGLTSVIRVAAAIGDIVNALRELTDVITRGIPIHPAISEGFKAAAHAIEHVRVGRNPKFVNKEIKDVIKDGADIIGLRRNDVWSYLPSPEEKVRAGDELIISKRKGKGKMFNLF